MPVRMSGAVAPNRRPAFMGAHKGNASQSANASQQRTAAMAGRRNLRKRIPARNQANRRAQVFSQRLGNANSRIANPRKAIARPGAPAPTPSTKLLRRQKPISRIPTQPTRRRAFSLRGGR